MHWDDKSETLTIGSRRGSFPGMLEHRTFQIVRITDAHGVGITPAPKADATIEFEGKAVSVRVPLPPTREKM
jgi:alpha-D-xyloside xylohydrolase